LRKFTAGHAEHAEFFIWILCIETTYHPEVTIFLMAYGTFVEFVLFVMKIVSKRDLRAWAGWGGARVDLEEAARDAGAAGYFCQYRGGYAFFNANASFKPLDSSIRIGGGIIPLPFPPGDLSPRLRHKTRWSGLPAGIFGFGNDFTASTAMAQPLLEYFVSACARAAGKRAYPPGDGISKKNLRMGQLEHTRSLLPDRVSKKGISLNRPTSWR
jgi:hypothetical protein